MFGVIKVDFWKYDRKKASARMRMEFEVLSWLLCNFMGK